MNKIANLDEAERTCVLGTMKARALPQDREARARHYRLRAGELRVVAEEAMLKETNRTLLSLADSYEHVAAMLETGFTDQ